MRELLQKIDAEYGFRLGEAEIERILTEVREAEPLFEQLNQIDVTAKTPFMRLDVRQAKR